MTYRHLTNLQSPVDNVDGNFLNTLADYKLGPPVPTPERDQYTLVMLGVMGVYTTEARVKSKEVRGLTNMSKYDLSPIILGETYANYDDLMKAYGPKKAKRKGRKVRPKKKAIIC